MDDMLENSEVPLLVDFYATWYVHVCKQPVQ
jgi:hypothetical protein